MQGKRCKVPGDAGALKAFSSVVAQSKGLGGWEPGTVAGQTTDVTAMLSLLAVPVTCQEDESKLNCHNDWTVYALSD